MVVYGVSQPIHLDLCVWTPASFAPEGLIRSADLESEEAKFSCRLIVRFEGDRRQRIPLDDSVEIPDRGFDVVDAAEEKSSEFERGRGQILVALLFLYAPEVT